MRKDKTKQFNQVAQKYDQYAMIQKRMAYRLVMDLCKNHCVSHIIELGCGTGYLTQLLISYLKPKQLTAIDIAEKMIQQAQKQVQATTAINWMVGDIEEVAWAKPTSADLVISNAVLHWVENPVCVLKKCWYSLRRGGDCIHTMMGPDTFQELRVLFRQVELDMGLTPALHHYPLRSAKEWEEIYQKAGFTQVNVVESWHRIEYADCRTFLQAIKSMGESFSPAKQSLFTSYHVLLQVMQRYNLAYRSKTGVYATFHVIQCTAKKK